MFSSLQKQLLFPFNLLLIKDNNALLFQKLNRIFLTEVTELKIELLIVRL